MINYNLRERGHKNHEMDGRYGTVVTNTVYAGYPLTIVDDNNGTDRTLCLLHLSKDVRTYTRLKLYDEFLYLNFSYQPPTYRMYDYTKVELSDQAIISILMRVLYLIQPSLQAHSLVGTSLKGIENDPNYYSGHYVLNDEEEYTILKCRDKYKFFKGKKSYYPDWDKTEDFLYEGIIDFSVYKVSLEVERLRRIIVTKTNEMLDDESLDHLTKYRLLKNQLLEELGGE